MSKTQQVLSKTLTLPAIGSFQHLAAVDPGLITANGAVLRPYIDTPDKDLAFNINANGTIDIYNISGRNLAAGKQIVVSATDKWFNAPVGGEQTIDTVATYPQGQVAPSIISMWAASPDNQVFANTPTVIAFSASNASTLISTGLVDSPATQSGAFVVRKTGRYQFFFDCLFSVTSGAAGTVSVQRYVNDIATSNVLLRRSVDFSSGMVDQSISFSFSTAVTQAALDAAGGAYKIDIRISTSAATINAKMGGPLSTAATTSSTMSVLYLGADSFTAA